MQFGQLCPEVLRKSQRAADKDNSFGLVSTDRLDKIGDGRGCITCPEDPLITGISQLFVEQRRFGVESREADYLRVRLRDLCRQFGVIHGSALDSLAGHGD